MSSIARAGVAFAPHKSGPPPTPLGWRAGQLRQPSKHKEHRMIRFYQAAAALATAATLAALTWQYGAQVTRLGVPLAMAAAVTGLGACALHDLYERHRPHPFGEFVAESHEERPDYFGGDWEQYKFKFPNGYGASVIRGGDTYGGSEGLWEMAVLGLDGSLCYSTPVTDNVMGHLQPFDVGETLVAISRLSSDE